MNKEKNIEELAYEIASLEEKIKTEKMDKKVQSYMRQIENIMDSLSFDEMMELDNIVSNIMQND